MGHADGGTGHEHRCSGNPRGASAGRFDEHPDRQRFLLQPDDHQLAPACPGGEHGEGDRADQQREPAADRDLQQVRAEIGDVDHQEQRDQPAGQQSVPLPQREQDHRDQQRVDEHRAGDRNAIGGGEVRRGAEVDHQQQDHDHQRPVDRRDIDLPGGGFAGVGDPQAGDEAQLDCLLSDREGARNDRLAGNDRGCGGEQHERKPEHLRG